MPIRQEVDTMKCSFKSCCKPAKDAITDEEGNVYAQYCQEHSKSILDFLRAENENKTQF